MNELGYKIKSLNWTLIFLILSLSFIGLVMIYSATNLDGLEATRSQFFKLLLGFGIMFMATVTTLIIGWKKKIRWKG